MLNTPILFVVFNRPSETEAAFNAICAAKPKKLYVAADGPRPNRDDDAKNCAQVRQLVTRVNWPCELKCLFRENNLGCKEGVSTAIDWFFENEPEGIILEDDCLPNITFFKFCEELLDKYRDDIRVMAISGRNPMGQTDTPNAYFFSRIFKEWGWASWRRAWQHRDLEKENFDRAVEEGFFDTVFSDPAMSRYLRNTNKSVHYSGHNTWDYQWQFNILSQNGVVVVPANNLVDNVGLASGVHFGTNQNINRNLYQVNTYSAQFPLKHPSFVFANNKFDTECFYVLHPYLKPKPPTILQIARDAIKHRVNKLLGK